MPDCIILDAASRMILAGKRIFLLKKLKLSGSIYLNIVKKLVLTNCYEFDLLWRFLSLTYNIACLRLSKSVTLM